MCRPLDELPQYVPSRRLTVLKHRSAGVMAPGGRDVAACHTGSKGLIIFSQGLQDLHGP
jgi:hypothetical protein